MIAAKALAGAAGRGYAGGMRIGLCTAASVPDLDRVARWGLRAWQWMRFADSPAGPDHGEWKPFVEEIAAASAARGLRLSAIGAWYANALDPAQTERARAVLRRACAVAQALGVKTVSAFAGGVIRWHVHPRGGQPVLEDLEQHLPALLEFWEPLARKAADHGVRLAFENCPQGTWHLPVMGYNSFSRPAIWERFFDATRCENLGLEWDPSHLICQQIDPVANLRKFGAHVFHVHAKDARVNRTLLAAYGPCHPGVTEHRMPGLGEADWAEIIRLLLGMGYDSDLNIEGRHDPVYRDHPETAGSPLAGQAWEEVGVQIARQTLERFVPPEAR